jgi:hypothetical protein
MGGWREGRCQEDGGEKLEEYCKEQGQLAEASKEGLGSEWAVVPIMMMMRVSYSLLNLRCSPVCSVAAYYNLSSKVVSLHCMKT